MLKVAVIILNWNGVELLDKFLPYALSCSNIDNVGIFVADNGSTDSSIKLVTEKFPGVKLLDLKSNYGFAEGYNRAIAEIESEYVVLLNSDVEVTPGWLEPQITYLDEHPHVAACQPKILWWHDKSYFEYAGACGGYVDKLMYPFCRGRMMSTLEKDCGQYNSVQKVFWASGASLFIRRDVYLEVGGLDSRFFAHMEEIDLCWRLWNRGHEVVVIPDSVVYHQGGATLNKTNPKKTYLNFRNNLLMTYKNLNAKRLRKVEQKRLLLDYIAIMFYIVKGEFANAKAVKRARKDYKLMKVDFELDRTRNLELTIQEPEGVMNSSLIYNYYFKRKKKFSLLNTDDFNSNI